MPHKKISLLKVQSTLILAIGMIALLIACAPPKRDLTPKQIVALDNFTELMWTMATIADPRFQIANKISPEQLTQEHFIAFVDMGLRLQVCAKRIPNFSKGERFDKLSKEMAEYAAALEKAATQKEPKQCITLTLNILDTCKKCHRQYR